MRYDVYKSWYHEDDLCNYVISVYHCFFPQQSYVSNKVMKKKQQKHSKSEYQKSNNDEINTKYSNEPISEKFKSRT